MAKVVLIDVAGWQGGVGAGRPYPNVGIGYLVATLKHSGHNVTVLDLNNEMISNGEISTCLVLADPTVVGISVKTATMKDACRVGQLVKRIMPRVPVVVGGPHATVSTQELIRENWVNFVLMGEGDLVFPELCHRLSRGLPVNDLPGVVCKGTISNPVAAARVRELDELPFPDFSCFGPGVREAIQISYPLITSRGCPYQCTYCSVGKISGKVVRYRSPVHVVEELSLARHIYGITGFEIIDDSFNVDSGRAKNLCRLLIERRIGLTWSCPNGIRADCVDAELADLMFQAGCRSVMVGVESADPGVLAGVKKGETLEEIQNGIVLLKGAGLEVGGFFIIGLPGDSYRAQLCSVGFALKHDISAHFNMLVPYPGTEVYDWVVSHGRFLELGCEGMHFSDSKVRPVFETDSFTARERQRAYEMAHTRLRRFDMLIPHTVPVWLRRLEVVRFTLRYDASSLLTAAVKAMARAAFRFRNAVTRRED